MTRATERALTVITAPAGYGKTVAIEHFLNAHGNAARVQCEGVSDRRTAWRKILLGLQATTATAANPDTARRLQALLPATEDDNSTVRLALLDELAGLDHTTVVALDGLEQVHDATIYEQLEFLVNRLPPPFRLVLVSRQRIPLPLERWRAQGRLSEVGPDELRFEHHEAAGLFDRWSGAAGPGAKDVEAFNRRAEGWPTGLHLLAASHRAGRPGHHPFDAGAARRLIDHLVSDQPGEVQEFLLDTAVLRQFTVDLCRAVTENDDAGRLLHLVEQANLFLVPLDERRQRFRYRRLFAELMRWERDQRAPGRARTLHRRAAAWFTRNDEALEAVGHLVAAGQMDEAFELAGADAAQPGREDSIVATDWATMFPLEWVEDDPARMVNYAALLGRSGWLAEAQSWIGRAEAALATWPEDDPRHALLLSIQAMWIGLHLDARRTIEIGERALQGLGSDPAYDVFRQRLIAVLLNARLVIDDIDGAERALAVLEGLQPTEIVQDLMLPGMQARVALRVGRLRRAEALGRRVLQAARTMHLLGHGAVRDANRVLGAVLAERGELANAEVHLGAAVRSARDQGWPVVAAYIQLELVPVRAAREGPTAGLAALAQARELTPEHPSGPSCARASMPPRPACAWRPVSSTGPRR